MSCHQVHAHLGGMTWHRPLLPVCTSIRVSPQSTFMLPAMEDISRKKYFVSKIDKLLADQLKWTPPGWKSPDTCGSLSHAPICKSYVPYCTVPLHQKCMFSCVFVLSPSTVLFRRMTQTPRGINTASVVDCSSPGHPPTPTAVS